jgi:hypothetical protein
MRFEPIYTVRFTTPEAWSVGVAGDAGVEGRSFLLAEGRCTGRLSARFRAANFPRKRADGALVPEFRGVLEPTTVVRSCSSGRAWQYATRTAGDSCSEASSTRPTTRAIAG